jgi:hypothetical protein
VPYVQELAPDIICLDYFWQQNSYYEDTSRYNSNWFDFKGKNEIPGGKISHVFRQHDNVKVFIMPKNKGTSQKKIIFLKNCVDFFLFS